MDERRVAVVVEDDEDIRTLLVTLLGQSGFEVHAAAHGAAGVDVVREIDPVLVTVDLGLPDIDGYEVTRRIRKFTDAYVVMLTARTEEIDTLMGLDAGADDYVTKPFRPRELRARIEAMLRRPRAGSGAAAGSPMTPDPPAAPAAPEQLAPGPAEAGWELDGLVLFPQIHQVAADGRDISLTPTEFVLLATLLRGGRIVRSKTELARLIRGEDADSGTFVSEADERSVEVHVANLRRKIGDDPRAPRWLQTVRGVGYQATGTARPSAS